MPSPAPTITMFLAITPLDVVLSIVASRITPVVITPMPSRARYL